MLLGGMVLCVCPCQWIAVASHCWTWCWTSPRIHPPSVFVWWLRPSHWARCRSPPVTWRKAQTNGFRPHFLVFFPSSHSGLCCWLPLPISSTPSTSQREAAWPVTLASWPCSLALHTPVIVSIPTPTTSGRLQVCVVRCVSSLRRLSSCHDRNHHQRIPHGHRRAVCHSKLLNHHYSTTEHCNSVTLSFGRALNLLLILWRSHRLDAFSLFTNFQAHSPVNINYWFDVIAIDDWLILACVRLSRPMAWFIVIEFRAFYSNSYHSCLQFWNIPRPTNSVHVHMHGLSNRRVFERLRRAGFGIRFRFDELSWKVFLIRVQTFIWQTYASLDFGLMINRTSEIETFRPHTPKNQAAGWALRTRRLFDLWTWCRAAPATNRWMITTQRQR